MMNDFSNISAENELRGFATMTPEELGEFENWIDEQTLKWVLTTEV
jgi:hypothetical protein